MKQGNGLDWRLDATAVFIRGTGDRPARWQASKEPIKRWQPGWRYQAMKQRALLRKEESERRAQERDRFRAQERQRLAEERERLRQERDRERKRLAEEKRARTRLADKRKRGRVLQKAAMQRYENGGYDPAATEAAVQALIPHSPV